MEALSGFEPIAFFLKLALTKFYISVSKGVGFHNQLNKEPFQGISFKPSCSANCKMLKSNPGK